MQKVWRQDERKHKELIPGEQKSLIIDEKEVMVQAKSRGSVVALCVRQETRNCLLPLSHVPAPVLSSMSLWKIPL